jgi:hypothetical protein
MDRKRLLIVAVLCIVGMVLWGTGAAVAVPPHKHCMRTPVSWVEVGPRVFDHPHLHDTAFHNFHNNIHVGDVPTTIVGILSGECSDLPL